MYDLLHRAQSSLTGESNRRQPLSRSRSVACYDITVTKLTEAYPNAREFITEILDKPLWWNTLKIVVEFLHAKNVERVRLEYGAVWNSDPKPLKRTSKAESQIVRLCDLESVIKRGLDEGTIEWGKHSDFLFHPLGAEVGFMLCNDADLHFASADSSLVSELGHKIKASGVKVYDSGQLI
jgi:hypothetical protein